MKTAELYNYMEYINNEIIKNILLFHGETSDVDSIINHSSEAATNHGDNYCSNIVRLKLDIKLKSGKIFKKSLILKIFLKNLKPSAEVEMKKFFTNEATVYDQILRKLGKLAEENNFDFPRNWPNCYFGNTNILIFDDLKEEGFEVIPRENGLNLADAKLTLQYLGRLHGLSVVGEKRKLIDPSKIRTNYTWAEIEGFVPNIYKRSFQIVGDIVISWGSEWEEAGRNIKKYFGSISHTLNNLFNENVKLKVFNHGDAWNSNFLAKYTKDNNMETIKFVDFQNATYNSPGWELIYFLFSSLSGDLMINNYDELLSSYRSEFVDTLTKLGEDPTLAPTIEDIKDDIVRLHPFCLVIICLLLAVNFNISKEPITVEDLETDIVKFKSLYTSENWKNSMKIYIKYFQKHGVL